MKHETRDFGSVCRLLKPHNYFSISGLGFRLISLLVVFEVFVLCLPGVGTACQSDPLTFHQRRHRQKAPPFKYRFILKPIKKEARLRTFSIENLPTKMENHRSRSHANRLDSN